MRYNAQDWPGGVLRQLTTVATGRLHISKSLGTIFRIPVSPKPVVSASDPLTAYPNPAKDEAAGTINRFVALARHYTIDSGLLFSFPALEVTPSSWPRMSRPFAWDQRSGLPAMLGVPWPLHPYILGSRYSGYARSSSSATARPVGRN